MGSCRQRDHAADGDERHEREGDELLPQAEIDEGFEHGYSSPYWA